MKTQFVLVIAIFAGLWTGCTPNASQLKKVVEDNPEIIFNAIEKHPALFLESVNKAAQAAREQEEKKMMDAENSARDEEFKNPKQPVIDESRAIAGNKQASVTIVEYSDFECPFCRRGSDTINDVMAEYGDKVRLVFKHFPIEKIHPHAKIASQYFEAIALQDGAKAYEFKKKVFAKQDGLQDGAKFLDTVAKDVGANVAQVKKDISSPKVEERIKADQAEAEKFGFSGTPGYLINGVSLKGAYPKEEFKKIIDQHLSKK